MKANDLAEIRAVLSEPLALEPRALDVLLALAAGDEASVQAASLGQERGKRGVEQARGVAVVPLVGYLTQRPTWFSTSTRQVQQWLRQAVADPATIGVLLDVDSPGGSVNGVEELAAELRSLRARKPIVAVANPLAASAAYWIASSASEIVAAPGSHVGSIGVFMAHSDYSAALDKQGIKVTLIKAGKYKTEDNPYEPLSADARDHFQEMVNDSYSDFVTSVAAGRRTTESNVRSRFGEGRLVRARQALATGMVDSIATFDTVLRQLAMGETPRAAQARTSLRAKALNLEFLE